LICFASKITRDFYNKNFAYAGIILIGLNLNQYQNFAMPTCWPWIISLMLFYLAYLASISNRHTFYSFFLILIVLIAPQVFSLGFIIPIGIFIINFLSIFLKEFSIKKITLLLGSLISIVLSYYLSIAGRDETSTTLPGLSKIIHDPSRAILFTLSSFGAPFTPGSRYSSAISVIFGTVVAVLLLISLKNYSITEIIFNSNLIIYGIIFHLLQLFARYNGSKDSITIVSQPRYTTGALILLMGIFLCSLPYIINRKKFYVAIGLLIVMTISGLKTSWDFTQTRNGQSELVENCILKNEYENQLCFDTLYPGAEVLSKIEFSNAVNYILVSRNR
jgi:hypothetical protein